MVTKCMSCGGSKMKKMNTGGASGDKCKFPLCAKYEGSSFVGCLPCGASVKAGLATGFGGVTAGITKMISDAKKKNTAVKAGAKVLMEADPTLKKRQAMKSSRYTINNPIPEEKRGGAVKKKKYAMGGQTIVGMPGYNATTRPMQMKSGGATKNAKLAAVAPPRNKVTRADVLTRILKKKKK